MKKSILLSVILLTLVSCSANTRMRAAEDKSTFLQCQLVLEKEHGDNFQTILDVSSVSFLTLCPNNPYRQEYFEELEKRGIAVKSEPIPDSLDYLVTWEDSEGEHHFSLINDGTELGTAVFTHFPVYAPKTETEPDD